MEKVNNEVEALAGPLSLNERLFIAEALDLFGLLSISPDGVKRVAGVLAQLPIVYEQYQQVQTERS